MLRPRCTTLAARCAAASAMTTSRGGTQPRASSSVHIPVSPPLKNTAATSSSRGVPRAMVRRHRDWKRLSVSLSLRKVAEGMKSPVLTQRQRPQSQRPHGAGDGRALCSPTGPSQPGSHSNIPIFPARQNSTPPPRGALVAQSRAPGCRTLLRPRVQSDAHVPAPSCRSRPQVRATEAPGTQGEGTCSPSQAKTWCPPSVYSELHTRNPDARGHAAAGRNAQDSGYVDGEARAASPDSSSDGEDSTFDDQGEGEEESIEEAVSGGA